MKANPKNPLTRSKPPIRKTPPYDAWEIYVPVSRFDQKPPINKGWFNFLVYVWVTSMPRTQRHYRLAYNPRLDRFATSENWHQFQKFVHKDQVIEIISNDHAPMMERAVEPWKSSIQKKPANWEQGF